MPFAPHEIEHKKFVVALRGYAKDEVDAFLRAVAADYAALSDDVGRRLTTAATWPAQLSASIENIVREAWETARETKRRAEEEAADIRQAAHEEARRWRRFAEEDAAQMRAAAQRDVEERYAAIDRRVAELRQTEEDLREKLYAVEAALASVSRGLDEPEAELKPVLTAVR
jgi:DivIVA domain-containing protein